MPATPPSLAITLTGLETADTQNRLRALAQRLNLPVCDAPHARPCEDFHFTLSFLAEPKTSDDNILVLSSRRSDFKGHVYIDFVHGKAAHRRQFGGGRGQALPRALGLKQGVNPSVVDATAGLGRDAFVLASLGARVTMIERSPILAALLEDGLRRLAAEPELTDIARSHLQLVQDNAIDWLQRQAKTDERPEVVYLDPMYPQRSKSALVKKEMRALRALVGDDEDAGVLLQAARHSAAKRVVVKRPKGAPFLAGEKPNGNVQSKNTRYDIYSVKSIIN
ncbi:MAG TPA: hypothetical protein ENI97_13475 [Gammaproteobacteria bacterium]|nr:hypothetical protein [Gammaproteobacteria bacterium]